MENDFLKKTKDFTFTSDKMKKYSVSFQRIPIQNY